MSNPILINFAATLPVGSPERRAILHLASSKHIASHAPSWMEPNSDNDAAWELEYALRSAYDDPRERHLVSKERIIRILTNVIARVKNWD